MIEVAIVGGTGYTGVELLRLLIQHPLVQIKMITSRSKAGIRVDELFPTLHGKTDLIFEEPNQAALKKCDVVFFATPHGVAMNYIPDLWDSSVRIIDLGADFRLQSIDSWQKWYKTEHSCPELLNEAVYGLPELNRELIKTAKLVANPGCYPTATTLGLMPLLEQVDFAVEKIIVDAKSGLSGAGRNPSMRTLLCEASEGINAYAVLSHRHQPEIQQTITSVTGKKIPLVFTPHLAPMIRGIHATIYVSMPGVAQMADKITALYRSRYQQEPFVSVLPERSEPNTRQVRYSNLCQIALYFDLENDLVIIFSIIDNLIKGASGQAIQNMNIMFGLDEKTGLEQVPIIP